MVSVEIWETTQQVSENVIFRACLGLTVRTKKPSRSRTRRCVTDITPMLAAHPRDPPEPQQPRARPPHTWNTCAQTSPNCPDSRASAPLRTVPFALTSEHSGMRRPGRGSRQEGVTTPRRGATRKSARACVGTPPFMRAPRPARASRGQSKYWTTATPCGQTNYEFKRQLFKHFISQNPPRFSEY